MRKAATRKTAGSKAKTRPKARRSKVRDLEAKDREVLGGGTSTTTKAGFQFGGGGFNFSKS